MNLLRDPWISVQGPEGVRLIGLGKLLCTDEALTLCLPRDDMELSTLQLAICLTQIAVMPEDLKELKNRIRQPMSEVEYQQRTESLVPWFQLDHPEWPFMQTVGVAAKEVTPIQKLLPGLPEGNNHSFFNSPGEVKILGAPMVAVALFQQATMTPSFGGGFKNSLRGSTPLNTLIWDSCLRKMLWGNVLSCEALMDIMPNFSSDIESEKNLPTWVRRIEREEHDDQIGLIRGLFWQPSAINILWEQNEKVCDLIGIRSEVVASGFYKEKFNYTIQGLWPHPHSPREIDRGFMSLRTQVPAWTQCSSYIYKDEHMGASGHIPAAVITQGHSLRRGQGLNLLIGGYCNNQANIIERRFDFLSLGIGWETQETDRLKNLIEAVQEAKIALRKKLFWLKKGQPDKKMRGVGISFSDEAERLFYQETEPLIRQCLQTFTFKEAQTFKKELLYSVEDICMKIYNDLTKPFEHDPGMMASIAIGRRSLGYSLRELITPSEKKQMEKKEVKKNVSARKK